MSFRSIPRGAYAAGQRKSRRICTPVLPTRRNELTIDGLPVTVIHKNNRNMYLKVKPPYGDVEVTAPLRTSNATIVRFVRERMDWVESSQRRLQQMRNNVSRGTEDGQDDCFTWNTERERTARENIEARLPELVSHWEAVIGRSPTQISLRKMTSRWGSCTPSNGRIRLNLQLGLMDAEFLEYVLVHEMTHLRESGHGEGFQHLMDEYLPSWRELRTRINQVAVLRKES